MYPDDINQNSQKFLSLRQKYGHDLTTRCNSPVKHLHFTLLLWIFKNVHSRKSPNAGSLMQLSTWGHLGSPAVMLPLANKKKPWFSIGFNQNIISCIKVRSDGKTDSFVCSQEIWDIRQHFLRSDEWLSFVINWLFTWERQSPLHEIRFWLNPIENPWMKISIQSVKGIMNIYQFGFKKYYVVRILMC